MKKTIAKLHLLQHGLIREAQALDEMHMGGAKKGDEDNLEDKMETDGLAKDKEEDYIARIGKYQDGTCKWRIDYSYWLCNIV